MYDILIPLTTNYHWELAPFKLLFDRFWGGNQHITVLSDTDPHVPGMDFIQSRVKIPHDWVGLFTDNFIAYLKHDCRSEIFVLLMSDYWLIDHVNLHGLQLVANYMAANRDVIRVQISNGMDFGDISTVVDCGDIKIKNPPVFLRGSLIPGMWSRDLLIKYLEEGQNVWQMEVELTKTIDATPSIHSYVAMPYPIRYEHCARTRSRAVSFTSFPIDLAAEITPMIPAGYEIIR